MPDVEREKRENLEASAFYEASLTTWTKLILIEFTTNPDGQRGNNFRITVRPDEFNELAQCMMRADPAAALKAFGTVLQEMSETSNRTPT